MTDYTTIADTEIDQDSPITQPLLTSLRDNPIAITEGSSGAPKIQQSALDANVVGRNELRSATNSASGSLGSADNENVTIDNYAFPPAITVTGDVVVSYNGGTASGARYRFSTGVGESGTYSMSWRYLTT